MDKQYCVCKCEEKQIDWSDFYELAYFLANVTELFFNLQDKETRYSDDAELNDKFEQFIARIIELMWEKYE